MTTDPAEHRTFDVIVEYSARFRTQVTAASAPDAAVHVGDKLRAGNHEGLAEIDCYVSHIDVMRVPNEP